MSGERAARFTYRVRPTAHQERPERPERRRNARLEDCPPLFISGLRGTVHDVSRAGISLVLEEPVAPGTRCRLVLRDALDLTTQEMEAEAIWCVGGRAGFRWVGLTREQDDWLLRHFQAWLAACAGASRR
jgi:hypothetical protein